MVHEVWVQRDAGCPWFGSECSGGQPACVLPFPLVMFLVSLSPQPRYAIDSRTGEELGSVLSRA